MGILAIACAATTAKHFADAQNRDLPKNNQINFISCMCAAIIGCLLLASDSGATDAASGCNTTYLGSKGLLTAFIAAFVTGIIYKFFIKRNITVKMPEQVPPNISQTFKDIIPFSVCIAVYWVFDIVFRAAFGFCFAQGVIQVFQPLFTAAAGYIGLAVIYGAMRLFWIVGVHGPSIVQPGIDPIRLANPAENLQVLLAGGHPAHSLTFNMSLVGEFGGTGATFIVPIIFLLFMRSKQLKAVGKASVVPVMFAVNEPLLFAAPIILNPYFLIPFLFAPVANVLIGKFFIDFLGMNGFIYAMPWALPGPIGTFIDTNFQPISLVLVVVLLVVDFLIYYPFCKAYDNVLCKQEAETLAEEEAEETKAVKTAAAPAVEAPVVETASATEASAAPSALKGKDLRVLVLCAGAGTSALLANALKEGADELGIDITANAGAYGSHYAIMDQYNVIVLAPQVRTYYNEMKADTDRLGITLLSPKGKQYIDLTKDPKGAVAWIEENLEA